MYSAPFQYHRARSLADAHRLLAAYPGAKLLAGGHSLIPMMKLRLTSMPALVDIGPVAELRGVARVGDHVRIGALTTHAEIAAAKELCALAPAICDAAGVIGDPAVRNRGTIGGNIAHADPASDLPTVLVALDATVVTTGAAGERSIPAAQFFKGVMATDLRDDEIITAITLTGGDSHRASAYVKFAHPASRYAVIGAAAAVTLAGGKCTAARIAIGGLVPYARRLPAVEQALISTALDATAIQAATEKTAAALGDDVSGDIFASAEYRAAMAPVYLRRAIAAAAARAGAA